MESLIEGYSKILNGAKATKENTASVGLKSPSEDLV